MAFEHDVDTGTIFKNKFKTSDRHPDYKGSINQDGELRDIALWIKESANGVKYMFAKLSDKQEKPEQAEKPQAEFDEDIPF